MASSPVSPEIIAFAEFEANFRSREIRRNGAKVRLPDQSFQVLAMLLEHPGELVAREEIQKRLWPSETFVDFDHGLNNAVNRLREALGDSADSPRWIETLPRRGYRFIGSVSSSALQGAPAVELGASVQESELRSPPTGGTTRHLSYAWIAAMAGVVLILLLIGLNFSSVQQPLLPKGAPSEPIRSLVVLPLENLSGDPSQEYFADGITDALITNLASIGSLRVISRTSAMHYKGAHQSLPEIARELKVDAVVEGSIVRSGNRVRVTAQLLQATSDRHLWAKAYDRDMSEILSVQQDIAQSIAREIRAKLTPAEETKLASVHTVNPEAYEACLKGRYYLDARSLDGYNKGLKSFQHAVEVSPTYAPAYAGLASSYNLLGLGMGSISPIEAAKRARLAARRAIELDEGLADAHVALAVTLHRYDWNWAEAEKEYRRALDLDPHNALYRSWFAGLLGNLGRTEEARALREQGRDMDPLSVQGVRNIAGAYFQAHQPDQAIAYLRKAIASQSDSFRTRMDLATFFLENDRYGEAVTEFQTLMTLYGPNVFPKAKLGYTYALSGQTAEAEKILRELEKENRPGYPSYASAEICAALGRKEEALHWLRKAYEEHSPLMVGLNDDSAFASLHSDSRFQDLTRRLGLVSDEVQK